MIRKTCLLLLPLLCAVGASALPRWSELAAGPVVLPQESHADDGVQYLFGGRFTSPVRFETGYDAATGTGYLRTVSNLISSAYTLAPADPWLDGEMQVREPALAAKVGFQTRKTGKSGKDLVIRRASGTSSARTDRIACDPDTLDIDALTLTLPAFLKNRPRSFNADIVLKSRALKINVDFRYLAPGTWDFEKASAAFPAGFAAELRKHPAGFHVLEMKPTGLVGLVYTDSYYYIFLNDAERRFLGYFGGSGQDAEGLMLQLADVPGSAHR